MKGEQGWRVIKGVQSETQKTMKRTVCGEIDQILDMFCEMCLEHSEIAGMQDAGVQRGSSDQLCKYGQHKITVKKSTKADEISKDMSLQKLKH